ncbi:transcriptional regulator, LysR family [Ancylobacter novellus DSM 506]|uniref:Transcriptional regulator, LysR family n=1 Tax=Ancylobacter novellus (strain ATCC 8093 / DSM 506 / JCM 20403 / CCM 1077 / IAM 12100 / NBRC 12443 / NCIMB 10456) TaxID=639283 RepID=D7A3P4_ANCN5|nr:LysR family transcriptional regulator [Ancylobacter novellus]ADH91671.1 transcriptional regulator, LysR family [Ancylobacter novellus DSM 506]
MAEAFKNLAWDDFRLIKAVADAKGLPAAAAAMGVNHSTVFRRLKQIEEALGAVLFERHRTGYALTPAGEEMVALANRLDEEITAVGRKLAGREPAPSGELRVTTPDSLLIHLLMPMLATFRERYPEVRLDMVLSNQALNLSKRDADVAVRATDNPPENLVGRRVARIAWALYGRAADFPAPGEVSPEELDAHNWVSLGDSLGSLKTVKFVQENVAPEKVAYKINSVLGLAEAVEAGIGIGHIPCFIGDARPSLVRLGPANDDYAADLWLLTHPDLRHSPRVRAFLDFLGGEIARHRRFIEGQTGLQEMTEGGAVTA